MGTSVIAVGEKSVIFIDCQGKTPEHIEEISKTLEEARALISSSPEKSAYVITDMTNSSFNPEIVSMFNDFTKVNTKYVKESVLVGLSDQHKVLVSVFQKLHKREFHIVDTLDEAKAYLESVE